MLGVLDETAASMGRRPADRSGHALASHPKEKPWSSPISEDSPPAPGRCIDDIYTVVIFKVAASVEGPQRVGHARQLADAPQGGQGLCRRWRCRLPGHQLASGIPWRPRAGARHDRPGYGQARPNDWAALLAVMKGLWSSFAEAVMLIEAPSGVVDCVDQDHPSPAHSTCVERYAKRICDQDAS